MYMAGSSINQEDLSSTIRRRNDELNPPSPESPLDQKLMNYTMHSTYSRVVSCSILSRSHAFDYKEMI